jgi:hypothetical protein
VSHCARPVAIDRESNLIGVVWLFTFWIGAFMCANFPFSLGRQWRWRWWPVKTGSEMRWATWQRIEFLIEQTYQLCVLRKPRLWLSRITFYLGICVHFWLHPCGLVRPRLLRTFDPQLSTCFIVICFILFSYHLTTVWYMLTLTSRTIVNSRSGLFIMLCWIVSITRDRVVMSVCLLLSYI